MTLTDKPDSITELFARDPLSWNEEDMKRLVAKYREKRAELDRKEALGKTGKSKVEKIAKEDLKGLEAGDLLGKLGIDLG